MSRLRKYPMEKLMPKWLMIVRENVSAYERGILSSWNKVCNAKSVALLLQERLGRLQHEEMVVLCIDGQNHLMHMTHVARGGKHGCSVSIGDILRVPCAVGASSFVLVHNHPSGDPNPSTEDIVMTRAVHKAGEVLGIALMDHVIIAGTKYRSMLDLGLLL